MGAKQNEPLSEVACLPARWNRRGSRASASPAATQQQTSSLANIHSQTAKRTRTERLLTTQSSTHARTRRLNSICSDRVFSFRTEDWGKYFIVSQILSTRAKICRGRAQYLGTTKKTHVSGAVSRTSVVAVAATGFESPRSSLNDCETHTRTRESRSSSSRACRCGRATARVANLPSYSRLDQCMQTRTRQRSRRRTRAERLRA